MNNFAKILSLGTLIAASAAAAHASTLISIGLQEAGYNAGGVTTVATDGGSGAAVFNGAYGTFNANLITALGAPQRAQGNLSTGSIQLSNSTGSTTPVAGTINVFITETGLTSPAGLTSFLSSFTSNTFAGSAISVVESTYYSNSNALYSGTQLATDTFTGIGTGTSTNIASLAGPYSETMEYSFTMGSTAASVNDTIDVTATQLAATPEPSSLVLLGTGLLSAGGTILRRRRLV